MSLGRMFLAVLLVCLFLLSYFIFAIPFQLENDKTFFLEAMRSLNQSETKTKLRALLDGNYNYTELLTWEHERLNFTNDPSITRSRDPMKILNYGKGRCQEFSLLYVALCLASGYQSRFVIDIFGDHTWAEIKLQDKWVHIDPTQKVINDPYMYERD